MTFIQYAQKMSRCLPNLGFMSVKVKNRRFSQKNKQVPAVFSILAETVVLVKKKKENTE